MSGPNGRDLLRDPTHNKGSAFSNEERDQLGLRGLLPAGRTSQDIQVTRVLMSLRRKSSDIERYIALMALLDRNERLFYRTLIGHIDELLPIIYTPTVGQACKEFAHIFRQPRGFYVTPADRGSIYELLGNWPEDDVRVIVVTDGERILGLGDLGANGMGIPIGKLALYSALADINPAQCMPVLLDVGTNNRELRSDPLYLGVNAKRLSGEPYIALVDEFVEAVQKRWPKALIQFEDFLTPNAYRLLHRYCDKTLCFNDDIQGTAAVALAGVIASNRITGHELTDLRIMFLGAGSAATGIADLVTVALMDAGLSESAARSKIWLVDVQGLITESRHDLGDHNRPYARRDSERQEFLEALDTVKPQVLIGATGFPKTFTEEVVRKMAEHNDRPVIFALSNPTSRAECTAEQAYQWSDGRAIFASGSPFPAMKLDDGTTWRPAQGNNAYVFPGIGLASIAAQATRVTDSMFLTAAYTLAATVSPSELDEGSLYPRLDRIRYVSRAVANAVAEEAFDAGVAGRERPVDLMTLLDEFVYDPSY